MILPPPRGHLAVSEHSFGCKNCGMRLLEAMLLNILQCTGQSYNKEWSGLKCQQCHYLLSTNPDLHSTLMTLLHYYSSEKYITYLRLAMPKSLGGESGGGGSFRGTTDIGINLRSIMPWKNEHLSGGDETCIGLNQTNVLTTSGISLHVHVLKPNTLSCSLLPTFITNSFFVLYSIQALSYPPKHQAKNPVKFEFLPLA